MNTFLSLSPETRIALVFIFGTVLGAAANVLIYSQGFLQRPVSPWMPLPLDYPRRRKTIDRVPVLGWLSLSRESQWLGCGFWVRPLFVELALGLGLAFLYRFETEGGLLPPDFMRPLNGLDLIAVHYQFFAHAILIFWMTAATFIDVDEMIIPDSITVLGTLSALAIAGSFPLSALPNVEPLGVGNGLIMQQLILTSPNDWPAWLSPPSFLGLAIGAFCWLGWCFALLPRTWYMRHGLVRAIVLCWTRIVRERFSHLTAAMAVVGFASLFVFRLLGAAHWQSMLSSLIGMTVGGGIVWVVRIFGALALRREAMGFGDVTLMAMIGAFLGWQASLLVFFLSPFAALVFAVLRLLFFREREIPFGPFLCLAALATVLAWDVLWDYVYAYFQMGLMVPIIIASLLLVILPPLLIVFRLIFRR